MKQTKTFLYAAVGARLGVHEVNLDAATLERGPSIELPAPVHYVWPHPSRGLLYVVSSDGLPGNAEASSDPRSGATHLASVLSIDAETGAMRPHGGSIPLTHRPIHCTVDPSAEHLLVAYNWPSAVTVHPIRPDGSLGEKIAQPPDLDFGIYGHQVRVFPGGKSAVLVARGNDAHGENPEDPGALEVFELEQGTLRARASITPEARGGLGFGPRHLDFHPHKPWAYVSVERHNELHVYRVVNGETLAEGPEQVARSVADSDRAVVRQMASAIHVHPNGRFVYQANRTDGRIEEHGWSTGGHGEDSLVVYALDATGGRVSVLQRVLVPAIHLRTFSIDPSGKLLVAASIQPVPVRGADGGVRLVPAALLIYRIGEDGRLTFVRAYEVNTRGAMMFWTGIVGVASDAN